MYILKCVRMCACSVIKNDTYAALSYCCTETGISANLSTQWKKVETEFDAESSFKVRFVGVRGSGHQGDYAIDDIQIFKGFCSDTRNYSTNSCRYQG